MKIKDLTGFLQKIIIIDAISAVIVLLYWFIKGPHNLVHLVDCFSYGGIFLMIPGAFIYIGPRSVLGKSFLGRNVTKQSTPIEKSVSDSQTEEYKKEQIFYRRVGTMLLIAGIVLILIGLLIYAVG